MAVKKYRVAGQQKFGDHAPGEVFEAELQPEQEGPLIQIGAIEVVVSHRDEKPKQHKQKEK